MAGLGSEKHEYIVDLVRFEVAELLQKNGYEEMLIAGDETFFSLLSGQQWNQKQKKYPDCFFSYDGDGVCIEVGDYNPSKWFEFPVVHVGFNGIVTPIRCEGSKFGLAVYIATVQIIEKHMENDIKEK